MDSWKSSAARKKINRCGKKEDQQARNVREVAKCCVFQCFVCRLGRKVTSLKRRVRRWLLREDMKNCTPLWREAHLQVKMYKTQHSRTTFWSCDVEKLHAAVARSTFSSQNRKKLTVSDHFLKLRCGKIARRCGEKHICKSKCTKHSILGPLFEVAMRKNCTPLWREAHFEVKMLKNWPSRATFWRADVEQLLKNGTPLWRQAHLQVKMYKTPAFCATFGGSTVRFH